MKFREDGDVPFQLGRMLNSGLTFMDNIQGSLIEVDFEDGLLTIEHGLGATPIGYIVLMKDGEADIWATRLSEWNQQTLYLASNVPSLKVRLFVM